MSDVAYYRIIHMPKNNMTMNNSVFSKTNHIFRINIMHANLGELKV